MIRILCAHASSAPAVVTTAIVVSVSISPAAPTIAIRNATSGFYLCGFIVIKLVIDDIGSMTVSWRLQEGGPLFAVCRGTAPQNPLLAHHCHHPQLENAECDWVPHVHWHRKQQQEDLQEKWLL